MPRVHGQGPNQSAACHAAWDAIDTLRDAVPQTFAELAAKANCIASARAI
jgi:hypothetical protein